MKANLTIPRFMLTRQVAGSPNELEWPNVAIAGGYRAALAFTTRDLAAEFRDACGYSESEFIVTYQGYDELAEWLEQFPSLGLTLLARDVASPKSRFVCAARVDDIRRAIENRDSESEDDLLVGFEYYAGLTTGEEH